MFTSCRSVATHALRTSGTRTPRSPATVCSGSATCFISRSLFEAHPFIHVYLSCYVDELQFFVFLFLRTSSFFKHSMLIEPLVVLFCLPFAVDASVPEECLRSNGAEYRGAQRVTTTGQSCLNWANATRDYNVTARPDADTGIGNHSFCRNPDSSGKPWCYVMIQDGVVQRQDCGIDMCKDGTVGRIPTAALPGGIQTSSLAEPRVLEPVQVLPEPDVGESEAVQPVVRPIWPGRTGLKRKKDLGLLGYVLAIVMMALILLLGLGITFGYFYERSVTQALRRQQQQQAYEQEMQRVNLPLSAFSNPACELLDEMVPVNTTGAPQTLGEEPGVPGGAEPLMDQAGTPGA
ncbi:phosphoinositide-3-kinase-interacting protein 1-like [Arapaima gigas]